MKEILRYTLLGIALSACMVLGWWIGHRNCQPTTEYITDTITVCDTIVDFQPQYVYVDHFDTTLLPVLISDTVTDTLFVQIPISTYQYDTTITDTNYRTSLKAVVSGFGVSVDTLCLSTEIMQQQLKNRPKWYNNICPAVGVGYGTGGFGIFLGVGYKFF